MSNFNVNVDDSAIVEQHNKEIEANAPKENKTAFDAKNYLNTRLANNESTRTVTVRLLPFDVNGGSPFKKVHMHSVKVNKEISPSGYKKFVCPKRNKKSDGTFYSDKCPFCETSLEARNRRYETKDTALRKTYGDIEYANSAREMWIVRCIERGHEDEGVKFWMFPSNKNGNGVYDQMINLYNLRKKSAAKKGNNYNIFDVNNGEDFILTINRTSDNKTSIQVVDEGIPSPLTNDVERGNAWIADTKKWDEVYTVKPYDYMAIVLQGGVPVYNKVLNTFVDKYEQKKADEAARKEELAENLQTPTKDFSEFAKGMDDAKSDKVSDAIITNGNELAGSNESDDEDLPF